MSVLKEFKDFAMRGNVIDLAVGVIIGGVFGKIVASLVADVIMPPIGLLVGGVEKAAVTLNYGNLSASYVRFYNCNFCHFYVYKRYESP